MDISTKYKAQLDIYPH